MKTFVRFLFILLTLGIITGVFLFLSGSISLKEKKEEVFQEKDEVLPVKTNILHLENEFKTTYQFLGTIEAVQESNLGFELSGLLSKILVDEGEVVHQNDILAKLDTSLLDSKKNELIATQKQAKIKLQEMKNGTRIEDINAAQAGIKELQAKLEFAELRKKRLKSLLKQSASTQQDYDEWHYKAKGIEAVLLSAKENLKKLIAGPRQEQIDIQTALIHNFEAQIKTIELQIKKSLLRAPFDGVISKKYTTKGEVIEAGTPVVKLLESQNLQLRVGIPEEIIDTLSSEIEYQAIVESQSYSVTLKAILPESDPFTHTIPVLFLLKSPPLSLRSGHPALFSLPCSLQIQGFFIPIQALTEDFRGLWACYIAEPLTTKKQHSSKATHLVAKRQVEILYTQTKKVFVRGFLKESELLIIGGLHRLVPGQKVFITESK